MFTIVEANTLFIPFIRMIRSIDISANIYKGISVLNSKKQEKNSLYGGFYTGSNPQKFILQPFSTYILTFANISNSNISSECELAIIVTGNTSANTSKITWVTQFVAYMHSAFFFDTDNKLSFNIDPKTVNAWLVISLTRL